MPLLSQSGPLKGRPQILSSHGQRFRGDAWNLDGGDASGASRELGLCELPHERRSAGQR